MKAVPGRIIAGSARLGNRLRSIAVIGAADGAAGHRPSGWNRA
jgi:hypothetical protein